MKYKNLKQKIAAVVLAGVMACSMIAPAAEALAQDIQEDVGALTQVEVLDTSETGDAMDIATAVQGVVLAASAIDQMDQETLDSYAEVITSIEQQYDTLTEEDQAMLTDSMEALHNASVSLGTVSDTVAELEIAEQDQEESFNSFRYINSQPIKEAMEDISEEIAEISQAQSEAETEDAAQQEQEEAEIEDAAEPVEEYIPEETETQISEPAEETEEALEEEVIDGTGVISADQMAYFVGSQEMSDLTFEEGDTMLGISLANSSKKYKGIDVSHHQGTINWSQVKADGISFAIIRVSDGDGSNNGKADRQFATNIAACKKYGIPYGIYIYSRATSIKEIDAEVAYVKSRMTAVGAAPTLPVFLDVEEWSTITAAKKNGTTLSALCVRFCQKMVAAGYRAGVYSSKSWYEDSNAVLGFANSSSSYYHWVAQWNASQICTYSGRYECHQYSATGAVAGISGDVDMNYWYGTLPTTAVSTTGLKLVVKNGKTYCYNMAGTKMYYGQQKVGGKWYYFDDRTGVMVTGWKYLSQGSKWVYYNSKGQMVYGQQKIGGKWYYFNTTSGKMTTGWVYLQQGTKWVYYDLTDGYMVYGQKKIGGKWYYFDEKTGAMLTGWKTITAQDKTVYYNADGQMVYGQQKIGGKWYYFDEKSGAMLTGWKTITAQNKTVYYDENGQMVYGTQLIDGETYHFDAKTGALIS